MNKWLFRAVGTVGVASGIWLLGGGAAHAQEAGATASDPQALRGLLNDLFSPASGLSDLGLSVDVPGIAVDTGLRGDPLRLRANDGRTGAAGKDIVLGGKLPDLTQAVPTVEVLPALDGLTGGLTNGGGLGGLVGGLTTGGGPLNLVGGLTGGQGGLLGGLTGGDSGLLGGLTGSDAGLLGGLTGMPTAAPMAAQSPATFVPDAPAAFDTTVTGLTNGSPTVRTSSGRPADLDPATAAQISQATQDMIPSLIAQAMADQMPGLPTAGGPDPFGAFDPSDDLGPSDADLAALAQMDPALFFADNPNVDVNWAPPEALPLVNDLPLIGSILGDQGLGRLIVVGDIAQKVPLVGPVLDGQGLPALDTLPVVGQVLNRGLVSNGRDGGLPVVGTLPVVGDVLGGLSADGDADLLGGLTGGNGALGSLTGSLSGLGNLGNLGNLGGSLGGLTGGDSPLGGLTGGEPMRAMPAPGMVTPFATGRPAAVTRLAAPHATARHAETERPIAGEDAEYPSAPESAEAGLPVLSLTRTLSQLPLVGDLPVVGSLPVGVALLRGLPLVGTVAGLLPID